jgi:hypothetical protein
MHRLDVGKWIAGRCRMQPAGRNFEDQGRDEALMAAHTIYVHLDDGRITEVPAVVHIHVTNEHVVLERVDDEPLRIARDTVFFTGRHRGAAAPPWT